jgi:hypothetical protein
LGKVFGEMIMTCLLIVHFLFEYPKVALNFSTNVSKSFSMEINAPTQAQTTLFYA